MMRWPPRCWLIAAGLIFPVSLSAQRTADEARLVFSVGVGQTASSAQLWEVPDQPLALGGTIDTLDLARAFRRTLNVLLSGTYFPGRHFGVNFEVQLLGLGTLDRCQVVSATADPTTTEVCADLQGRRHTGTAVSASVGGVYRPFSGQPIHPYFKVNTGVTISQQDYVKTVGTVGRGTGNESDVVVYQDPGHSGLQPYLAFGGGMVAVVGRGYQVRFELRDNWVRVARVTGPTVFQGVAPAVDVVGRHVLSFQLGFDVVLERKHGRRY
jgi:hypothetical protein